MLTDQFRVSLCTLCRSHHREQCPGPAPPPALPPKQSRPRTPGPPHRSLPRPAPAHCCHPQCLTHLPGGPTAGCASRPRGTPATGPEPRQPGLERATHGSRGPALSSAHGLPAPLFTFSFPRFNLLPSPSQSCANFASYPFCLRSSNRMSETQERLHT